MWEISNSLQLLSFARTLLLGVIICLIYDILRAYRKVYNFSHTEIFFQDVIFSIVTAFVVFLFLLGVTNGEMRGYVFFGLAIGFVISRLSLSRIWFFVLRLILSMIKSIFSLMSSFIYRTFDKIEACVSTFFKKSRKTIKKLLKTQGEMLYTKGKRNTRGGVNEKETKKE